MKKCLANLFFILTIPLVISGWKFAIAQKPILENVVCRTFSNPLAQDKFSILIYGKSIIDGTMRFTISNSDGKTINLEEYPSKYLIGYGLVSPTQPTLKEEEEYIKKRVVEFFNEENFSNTAIEVGAQIDTDYSNEENWNDIKSDQTAVGFSYLIGEEARCQMAYSKKKRKIVKYFCCC